MFSNFGLGKKRQINRSQIVNCMTPVKKLGVFRKEKGDKIMQSFEIKRLNKLFLSFLVLTMVVFLLTGCGGTAKTTQQDVSKVPATASDKEPTTVEEIAKYEGANREQRLVDAAKKEGTLNLYTAMNLVNMEVLTQAFEKKYGIKVSIWRSGSENVLQRIVTEAQGKRFGVDVVETPGPELESLQREKLLQEVKSPFLKDLIPEAILPHKEWVATRINVIVQAWNTAKVKKEELPQKWEEFLDPKWKGRLGIEALDSEWFAEIVKGMGEEKGVKFFKDIVATNGLSVRKGHSLLSNLVASGEVPLALTVYNYRTEQLKGEGAPIDWYAIEPAIALPAGVAVLKNVPHPNAAVLFYDFMLSDAQAILLEMDIVPTSKKAKTPLNEIKMKFVDPVVGLDEKAKWDKLYEEIIVKQQK